MEGNDKQNIFLGLVANHDNLNQNMEDSQEYTESNKARKCMKGKTYNHGLAKSHHCQWETICSQIPLLEKCKSTQQDCFQNVTQEELRSTIYGYLKKIIETPQFLQQQIKQLDFPNLTKSLMVNSTVLITGSSACYSFKLNNSFLRSTLGKQLQKIKPLSKSISIQDHCGQKQKSVQTTNITSVQSQSLQNISLIIWQGQCESQKYVQQIEARTWQQNQNTNISIVLEERRQKDPQPLNTIQTSIVLSQAQQKDKKQQKNNSLDDAFSEIKIQLQSSDLFSPYRSQYSNESQSFHLLLNDSRYQFNQQFIANVFDDPDPFLMNLSLCLLMKFMFCSQIKLNYHNICPIIGLSTLISYKIFYDLPIKGLVQFFSAVLNIKQQQLIVMERNYLSKINYESVISNEQYHKMLAMILKEQKETREIKNLP